MDAAHWYRRAIALDPGIAAAHNNLGRALLNVQDPQAAHHFRVALHLKPHYFEAAEGLGICLYRAGSYEEAAAAFAAASLVRPGANHVRLLLARAWFAGGQLDSAGAEFERLLAAHPRSPQGLSGLAAVLAGRGQYTKPRSLFEQALASQPDDPWAKFNYALFLLRIGDFSRAWDYYEARVSREARWQQRGRAEIAGHRPPPPVWQGEPLRGKRLLVTCEQGLGDEIMFSSLFPEVIAEAAHCIIECDRRLAMLFRRSFPTATVFDVGRSDSSWFHVLEESLHLLPAADYWIPAGSLPRLRRRTAGDFPGHCGYLAADPGRIQHWQSRLRELGPGLKIGISWRGGTSATNTAARSLSLAQLAPLLATPRARFVSLQYGNCRGEIDSVAAATGVPLHHWQEAIDDYDETAALVSSLDLVISVCTAVVHLTGALGRPAWVLVPRVAEWRYGHESESMVWYPSVRLFRQVGFHAWAPVVSRVGRHLQEMLRGEAAP